MLLDSNILIYGAEGDEPQLDEILGRSDLSVASVTRIETIGYHRLSEVQRRWLEAAIDGTTVLPLDEAVTSRAIVLRQQRKMSLADAIIAATALVYDLPLVTRNVDDFNHIEELRIINPLTSGDSLDES
jgi:predicted nucleic acid-binding protein